MNFTVYIKSGTSGHYDPDNCDLRIAEIADCEIPRQGETITINHVKYLVREIRRSYVHVNGGEWKCFVSVYVMIL